MSGRETMGGGGLGSLWPSAAETGRLLCLHDRRFLEGAEVSGAPERAAGMDLAPRLEPMDG